MARSLVQVIRMSGFRIGGPRRSSRCQGGKQIGNRYVASWETAQRRWRGIEAEIGYWRVFVGWKA